MRKVYALLLAFGVILAFAMVADAATSSDAVSDQQDVHTSGDGTVNVRFDQGDEVLGFGMDTCLSGKPTVVVQAASTLSAGKAQIVTHRERFNTACSFQLTASDKFGNPITNADVRIAYIAVVQGEYDLG